MHHTLTPAGVLPTAGAADVPAKLLSLVRETYLELNRQATHPIEVVLDSALDRDLGMDSLARVELLLRVERAFDVHLPEALLAQAQTPRDVLKALLTARQMPQQPGVAALSPVSSWADGAAAWPTDSRMWNFKPEPTTPEQASTLLEVLRWHVQRHPERTQIIVLSEQGEQPVTYADLLRGAQAVARKLQALGLGQGDARRARHGDASGAAPAAASRPTVAIMLPTSPEYFDAYLGILLAGAVPVPIYPPTRPSQMEDHVRRHANILANAQAAVLITVPEALPVAHLLEALVPCLHKVITLDRRSEVDAVVDAAPDADASRWPPLEAVPVTGADIAFIQYTSGSTGDPKGVTLTHANLLANIRAIREVLQLKDDAVFVSWLPLYHDMGLIGAWLCSLYTGNRLVVMSPLAFLMRPQSWLWAIHRHHGTHTAAPNFAYELCLRHIGAAQIAGLNLHSLQLAANGAEPVSPETITRFTERFAPYGFEPRAMTPVYGLAECSVALLIASLQHAPLVDFVDRNVFMQTHQAQPAVYHDAQALRFVACGLPLPGHRVRILDDNGDEVAERVEGRLEFQGPSATSGYYRRPEESRKLMHDGWLDTGDRAYRADGEIFITGRVKDIIIRGGRNIYPHEIELAVGELPGVRKGCIVAFGAADAVSGTERLVVLAETRETQSGARARLREAIMDRVTDTLGEPPDDIVLAPLHTVRKTSSGKLRRAATRDAYLSGAIGQRPRAVWWQFTRLGWSAVGQGARHGLARSVDLLYGAWFWLVFALVAPPTWLLVALLPRPAWAWRVAHHAAGLQLWLTDLTPQVRGRHNLPAAAHMLVVNHASDMDGMMLVAALPRPYRFVVKNELLRNPFARLFLQRLGSLFVERFDARRSVEDAHQLAAVAASGVSLCVFPEGTFRRDAGLLSFHLGPFEAAEQSGIAVVPVTLRGTRAVYPDGAWAAHHHSVHLSIGDAIHAAPEAKAANDPSQPNKAFTAAVALRDATRAAMLHDLSNGRSNVAAEPPLNP